MAGRKSKAGSSEEVSVAEITVRDMRNPAGTEALGKTRLLTAEQEADLARRVKTGDSRARQKMVEANMRLVMTIARKYQSPAVPYEDLVQEGAIGLITACERFDPERGLRFSTYAIHWIRQAIIRALDNKSRAIRIPAHITDALRKLERAHAELLRESGEDPSLEQVAERAGIPISRAAAIIRTVKDPISLDMLVGEEENASLGSLLAHGSARDPEASAIQGEVSAKLMAMWNLLPERERRIVGRRLGLEDNDPALLQDIGTDLSLSRERVRQIELQAFRRMRQLALQHQLHIYLVE